MNRVFCRLLLVRFLTLLMRVVRLRCCCRRVVVSRRMINLIGLNCRRLTRRRLVDLTLVLCSRRLSLWTRVRRLGLWRKLYGCRFVYVVVKLLNLLLTSFVRSSVICDVLNGLRVTRRLTLLSMARVILLRRESLLEFFAW